MVLRQAFLTAMKPDAFEQNCRFHPGKDMKFAVDFMRSRML